MKLTYGDIQGVVGIVPTPATADADRWDAINTVNIPESKKMIDAILDAGIEVIMTTGTFGECATLTWDELQTFAQCVIDTVGNRRPVFVGVTTLNTRDTITRARAVLDMGADGIFIGRPMWLSMDDKQIVRFYRDIANALPGTPIVVYDNPAAFKGKISTATYKALAEIPEIICTKHVGGPQADADFAAVGDRIRILPFDSMWYETVRKFPKTALACWSGNTACGPNALGALSRAILAEDWEAAEAITRRIKWALQTQFPAGRLSDFMEYSIPLGHARFRTSELIEIGPCRPPYIDVPRDLEAGSEEVGRRWKILQEEFAPQGAGSTR